MYAFSDQYHTVYLFPKIPWDGTILYPIEPSGETRWDDPMTASEIHLNLQLMGEIPQ